MKRLLILSLLAGACLVQAAPKGTDVSSPQYIKTQVEKIDRLVLHQHRMRQLKTPKKTTDEQFLRRTYLNIVGRIPSYEEALAFLNDENPNKRFELVNKLLDSDGYNSHMFNFWADLLRAKDSFGNGIDGRPYLMWIREAIEDNKPYDAIVNELVMASGGLWDRDNGAVGYYVRDRGMPLDNMANTTRIFLGTQIACAQCHDHPHEDWKQMEFFEMAAFTHGMQYGKGYDFVKKAKEKGGFREKELEENPTLRNLEREIRENVMDATIWGKGDGLIPLPKDYQYNDGKPGEIVKARTMMGKRVKNMRDSKMDDGKRALAEWITARENTTFTKVAANRMWKRVMGVGLVEPLDNFTKKTTGTVPGALDVIEQIMLDVDYDLKAFQRILYNTQVYQLGTNPKQYEPSVPYLFNGYPMNRMSAEQVWDSMLTLTMPEPDGRKSKRFNADIRLLGGGAILKGKKDMYDLQGEIRGITPDDYWNYMRDLAKEVNKSGKSFDGMMMSSDGAYSGFGGDFMRASELPSPTAPSHFLRKFGQSDRNVIDGSSREGDVTQILSLLNGHVEDNILNNRAALILKNVAKGETDEEKIKIAFLSILTRYPTEEETALMIEVMKDGFRDSGQKNMVAALLNTTEFMFNH